MSHSSPASEKKSVRGIERTTESSSSIEESVVFRQKCRVFAMRDNKWIELGQGDAKVSCLLSLSLPFSPFSLSLWIDLTFTLLLSIFLLSYSCTVGQDAPA